MPRDCYTLRGWKGLVWRSGIRHYVHAEPRIRKQLDKGITGCGGKKRLAVFRRGATYQLGIALGCLIWDRVPGSRLPQAVLFVSPMFSHHLPVSETQSLSIGDLSGSAAQVMLDGQTLYVEKPPMGTEDASVRLISWNPNPLGTNAGTCFALDTDPTPEGRGLTRLGDRCFG